MFTFTRHNYEPAPDADDDLDLVLLINEARDPQEIDRVARMARQRARGRRQTTAAEQFSRSSGTRQSLGRALSFRH